MDAMNYLDYLIMKYRNNFHGATPSELECLRTMLVEEQHKVQLNEKILRTSIEHLKEVQPIF